MQQSIETNVMQHLSIIRKDFVKTRLFAQFRDASCNVLYYDKML